MPGQHGGLSLKEIHLPADTLGMGTPSRSIRRRWVYFAARLIEVLWWCPCEYNNVATYRCRYCGAKPPREVREMLRSVPVPEALTTR